MSDIFARRSHLGEAARIGEFIAAAGRFDNLLIERYGCEPAPETRLTFLKKTEPRAAFIVS